MGILTFDSKPSGLWRLQDSETEQWLNNVDHNTWCLFKDVGKIRVGVKTTADNVLFDQTGKQKLASNPNYCFP